MSDLTRKAMSATAREATVHLAAVKAASSRVAALRYLLSLFGNVADDRLALRALAVDGEQHGFTYGDLWALVEVAEAAGLSHGAQAHHGLCESIGAEDEMMCDCGTARLREALCALEA